MEVAIKSAGLTLRGLLEGSDQVPNDRIAILMHGFKGDLGYTEENLLNQLAHRLNDRAWPRYGLTLPVAVSPTVSLAT